MVRISWLYERYRIKPDAVEDIRFIEDLSKLKEIAGKDEDRVVVVQYGARYLVVLCKDVDIGGVLR